MTATGLQKYIDINLDGTKTYKVDISIYSPDPNQGTIQVSELLTPTVETLTEVAEETLQNTHADSLMVFQFPKTEDVIECFRTGEGLVIRKA